LERFSFGKVCDQTVVLGYDGAACARFNPVGFFLGGYVKNIVYPVKINDLQHLKALIRDAVSTVRVNTFQATLIEVEYRLDICSATKGAHIEIYLKSSTFRKNVDSSPL
jgi:hypothetical protein